jgi:fluoroquinolone transport system permease protein
MSRLAATLRLDATLQARNHVYVIVGIAALALALPLRALFTPDQLRFFMPLLALSGVGITTFFLVAVLMMLERGEGTLDVVLVSPLRPSEYLASKLSTVTVLAIVEGAVITGFAYGLDVSVPWLVLAVVLRAGFVGAVGVAVGVRYRSITSFLFPAIGFTLLFDLPAFFYLELWPSPIFYLFPTMPSLLAAKAAFLPVDAAEAAYACVFGVLAVAGAVWWAARSLDRFAVRGERTR